MRLLPEDRWELLLDPAAGRGTVGAREEPLDRARGAPLLLPVTLSVQLFTLA